MRRIAGRHKMRITQRFPHTYEIDDSWKIEYGDEEAVDIKSWIDCIRFIDEYFVCNLGIKAEWRCRENFDQWMSMPGILSAKGVYQGLPVEFLIHLSVDSGGDNSAIALYVNHKKSDLDWSLKEFSKWDPLVVSQELSYIKNSESKKADEEYQQYVKLKEKYEALRLAKEGKCE